MIEARSTGHPMTKRPFKAMVSIITLWSFLFGTVCCDVTWAAKGAIGPTSLGSIGTGNPGGFKDVNVETFSLPEYLGHIKDSYKGNGSDKVVIHIQDAHCNYAAQHKISEIIEYLNKEYGVDTINLEGGAKDYDLSTFTRIYDRTIREKTSDYFVKEGLVNGAEYFAINNPEKATLWGIEDTKLYVDNLKVYRDSLKYKEEVDKHLNSITHIIGNLKTKIYSPELLDLDNKYSKYKTGTLEFKDYLTYLIQAAKSKAIDIKGFNNIYLLSQSLAEESNIDFKKANNQRDDLIDRLQKKLSKKSLEELVVKTVEFRSERISQKDFYGYLIKKANLVSIELNNFPDLQKYIVYISMYNAIDKMKVMEEIDKLENEIKDALYQNDQQKELSNLSKNLAILKNIFTISLTKEDYKYYIDNEEFFYASNYISFISKVAPLFKITAQLDQNITDLDRYRENISRFYDYSFKRDKTFVKNLVITSHAAILITGGFHTENLCEMFKEENISYISIMPNFTNGNGYECPYFNLLKGETGLIGKALYSAISGPSSAMATAALSTALGRDVWGERNIEEFKLWEALVAISVGKKWAIDSIDISSFSKKGGMLEFKVNGDTESIAINDLIHQAGEIIDEKMSGFQDIALTDTSKVKAVELARKLGDIVQEGIDNLNSGAEREGHRLHIQEVAGLPDGQNEHAGGYGVSIRRGLAGDERTEVILHGIVAGFVEDHTAVDGIVKALLAGRITEAQAIFNSTGKHKIGDTITALWDMTAVQRQSVAARRDFATDSNRGKDIEKLTEKIDALERDHRRYMAAIEALEIRIFKLSERLMKADKIDYIWIEDKIQKNIASKKELEEKQYALVKQIDALTAQVFMLRAGDGVKHNLTDVMVKDTNKNLTTDIAVNECVKLFKAVDVTGLSEGQYVRIVRRFYELCEEVYSENQDLEHISAVDKEGRQRKFIECIKQKIIGEKDAVVAENIQKLAMTLMSGSNVHSAKRSTMPALGEILAKYASIFPREYSESEKTVDRYPLSLQTASDIHPERAPHAVVSVVSDLSSVTPQAIVVGTTASESPEKKMSALTGERKRIEAELDKLSGMWNELLEKSYTEELSSKEDSEFSDLGEKIFDLSERLTAIENQIEALEPPEARLARLKEKHRQLLRKMEELSGHSIYYLSLNRFPSLQKYADEESSRIEERHKELLNELVLLEEEIDALQSPASDAWIVEDTAPRPPWPFTAGAISSFLEDHDAVQRNAEVFALQQEYDRMNSECEKLLDRLVNFHEPSSLRRQLDNEYEAMIEKLAKLSNQIEAMKKGAKPVTEGDEAKPAASPLGEQSKVAGWHYLTTVPSGRKVYEQDGTRGVLAFLGPDGKLEEPHVGGLPAKDIGAIGAGLGVPQQGVGERLAPEGPSPKEPSVQSPSVVVTPSSEAPEVAQGQVITGNQVASPALPGVSALHNEIVASQMTDWQAIAKHIGSKIPQGSSYDRLRVLLTSLENGTLTINEKPVSEADISREVRPFIAEQNLPQDQADILGLALGIGFGQGQGGSQAGDIQRQQERLRNALKDSTGNLATISLLASWCSGVIKHNLPGKDQALAMLDEIFKDHLVAQLIKSFESAEAIEKSGWQKQITGSQFNILLEAHNVMKSVNKISIPTAASVSPASGSATRYAAGKVGKDLKPGSQHGIGINKLKIVTSTEGLQDDARFVDRVELTTTDRYGVSSIVLEPQSSGKINVSGFDNASSQELAFNKPLYVKVYSGATGKWSGAYHHTYLTQNREEAIVRIELTARGLIIENLKAGALNIAYTEYGYKNYSAIPSEPIVRSAVSSPSPTPLVDKSPLLQPTRVAAQPSSTAINLEEIAASLDRNRSGTLIKVTGLEVDLSGKEVAAGIRAGAIIPIDAGTVTLARPRKYKLADDHTEISEQIARAVSIVENPPESGEVPVSVGSEQKMMPIDGLIMAALQGGKIPSFTPNTVSVQPALSTAAIALDKEGPKVSQATYRAAYTIARLTLSAHAYLGAPAGTIDLSSNGNLDNGFHFERYGRDGSDAIYCRSPGGNITVPLENEESMADINFNHLKRLVVQMVAKEAIIRKIADEEKRAVVENHSLSIDDRIKLVLSLPMLSYIMPGSELHVLKNALAQMKLSENQTDDFINRQNIPEDFKLILALIIQSGQGGSEENIDRRPLYENASVEGLPATAPSVTSAQRTDPSPSLALSVTEEDRAAVIDIFGMLKESMRDKGGRTMALPQRDIDILARDLRSGKRSPRDIYNELRAAFSAQFDIISCDTGPTTPQLRAIEEAEGMLEQYLGSLGISFHPVRAVFIPDILVPSDEVGRYFSAYRTAAFSQNADGRQLLLGIIHEFLHGNSYGFSPKKLNEGMTQYLALKLMMMREGYEHITMESIMEYHMTMDRWSYVFEVNAICLLIEAVGEAPLLEAYFNGNYNPLKEAFGENKWSEMEQSAYQSEESSDVKADETYLRNMFALLSMPAREQGVISDDAKVAPFIVTPIAEDTVEVRNSNTVAALKSEEDTKSRDPIAVVGLPWWIAEELKQKGLNPDAYLAALEKEMSRMLGKKEYGDPTNVHKFKLFIMERDSAATKSNLQKALETVKPGQEVVIFAPSVGGTPLQIDKTILEKFGNQYTVVPDAYSDMDTAKTNGFPDVNARIAITRLIAWCKDAESRKNMEGQRAALEALTMYLNAITDKAIPPVADLNDLLKRLDLLRIRPVNYKDIVDWRNSYEAVATAL